MIEKRNRFDFGWLKTLTTYCLHGRHYRRLFCAYNSILQWLRKVKSNSMKYKVLSQNVATTNVWSNSNRVAKNFKRSSSSVVSYRRSLVVEGIYYTRKLTTNRIGALFRKEKCPSSTTTTTSAATTVRAFTWLICPSKLTLVLYKDFW